MKQANYLAFYYNDISIAGGMNDCIGSFEKLSQAIKAIENLHIKEWPNDYHWACGSGHVYGIREGQLVHHHMKKIVIPEQLELFTSENL